MEEATEILATVAEALERTPTNGPPAAHSLAGRVRWIRTAVELAIRVVDCLLESDLLPADAGIAALLERIRRWLAETAATLNETLHALEHSHHLAA